MLVERIPLFVSDRSLLKGLFVMSVDVVMIDGVRYVPEMDAAKIRDAIRIAAVEYLVGHEMRASMNDLKTATDNVYVSFDPAYNVEISEHGYPWSVDKFLTVVARIMQGDERH